MLRTIISLCALLAALFFVFRGIQETSAHGQSPPAGAAARYPDSYQMLVLQRARSLRLAETARQRQAGSAAEELRVVAEEIELGWHLLELLEAEAALFNRVAGQRIGSAADENASEPSGEGLVENQEPAAETTPGDNATTKAIVESGTPALDLLVLPEQTPPARRELTAAQQALSDKIERCLTIYSPKLELSVNDHNCWEVMHTIIGYGVDNHVIMGRDRVNAIGYLCWNGKCRTYQLFENRRGELAARQGFGVQGHHGQFLAMLAQHRVTPEYTIKAGGRDFTIADLIEFEKRTCEPKSELTFKLIALSHYLDSDATWSNRHGQWSIPRLIQEELAQPVIGAACGGTHRLMGLSYAAQLRQKRGEPMAGEWNRARQYVHDYHEYAFSLQNRNGSFSTNWFEGRADSRDIQRYQETSGHITEWLAFSLPPERLHEPQMVLAVEFLADLLLENQDFQWKIGPRGHAIRALALYHERALGEKPVKYLAARAKQTPVK